MGVLTDLVCATEAEIAALDPDAVLIDAFPGLDIKGTGLIELATLFAIAKSAEFDPGLRDFPVVLGQESEDGPWVFRFPAALLHHLAGASAVEIKRLAMSWVKTEEPEVSGWTPPEAEARIAQMASFMRDARQADKPVHIWQSL